MVQLWRAQQLEAQTRRLELERAAGIAERILREAMHSRAALQHVAAERRCALASEGVVVDDAVGWLVEVPAHEDEDPVVEDRLARAARAEFAAGDVAAATREFDVLLAASLPSRQRLAVLAAAAWQAERAGDRDRSARLRAELDTRLADVSVRELGHLRLANAVAAAVRLPRAGALPPVLAGLVAALPRTVAEGLPASVPGRAAAAAVAARRACLDTIDAALSQRPATVAELRPRVHDDASESDPAGTDLIWIVPDGAGEGDARRGEAALLTAAEYVAAARAAGRDGALPEWPWLVEPQLGGVSSRSDAFGGVPGVRGVEASAGFARSDRSWLLPAITGALVLAFAGALWQQLRALRSEAAAVRTQAEFLTTVTHELKTPLASIRLLGEMLSEGRAKGRESDYYRMLAGEAGRLSMLIENVLDLGRLERGERAYDARPVDVGEVVAETLQLFEPVARQGGAGVTWDDRTGGDAHARLDRSALVQALVSVLDNARKYGGSGAPIEVVTARRGPDVTIAVADRGPGVPADEREKVFARFVRGRTHAHGSTPGVGIGLYLARGIARRLGGDLVCAGRADGQTGACFTFVFPAETTS
ncbi:MAG: ATP-binding protein [Planctomycetota bacterium]